MGRSPLNKAQSALNVIVGSTPTISTRATFRIDRGRDADWTRGQFPCGPQKGIVMPTWFDVVTKSTESAYANGYDSGMDGFGLEDCPYDNAKFRAAWRDGWRKADEKCKAIFEKNKGKQVGYG